MATDKQREQWIEIITKEHPKIPKASIEYLVEVYGADGEDFLHKLKKEEVRAAKKSAKKGKEKVEAEQDPDRFKMPGAIEIEHADQKTTFSEPFLAEKERYGEPGFSVADDFEKITIEEVSENKMSDETK